MERARNFGLAAMGLALVLGTNAQAQDAPAADAGAPAAAPDTSAPASDNSGSSGDESWIYRTTHNVDTSFGGFVRSEDAIRTTGQENYNNQRGNPFDEVSVPRQAYLPPNSTNTLLTNLHLPINVPSPLNWSSVPVVTQNEPGIRPIDPSNNLFHLHILRAEGELGVRFGDDLKLIARLRAIGDIGHYGQFDAASLDGYYGGISGGLPELYGGAPNYFQYHVDGGKHPNPLEWAGPNYMVYFPALVMDFNHGPLNVRVGNQSIAWGQAIFFRVLDVVDGLDLRRHSVLDYAQEEFSDKRVPSLAVRVGYQLTDDILADGFFQKFQPTVYGNPNTQYNVIPTQFTVHDRYDEGGYDNKYSYGIRLKANFGQWGFQAIAVRRYNPDGVFRWTQSGVDKKLPTTYSDGSLNLLGTAVDGANLGNAGTNLAKTPFEASPGGVYSADEWFHYAAAVRLDGISGLNASINDFQPATTSVFASPAANYQQAYDELNTFFIASGGLRGHIERDYFQEYNFGGGVSYVVDGEPGSLLDQLIINLETTYTPDRTYTAPTLGKNFLPQNDWVSALVMEKYQRFSQSFPATYFVFQYMHRTRDDLFGRSLEGYGGVDASSNPNPNATTLLHPQTNANYIVFAFQQPFPQDIYRVGFAVLADPHGGVLVQPGLQWKPSGHWAIDGFYTYINDRLGGNPNSNLLGGLGWANEFTLRVGYQF